MQTNPSYEDRFDMPQPRWIISGLLPTHMSMVSVLGGSSSLKSFGLSLIPSLSDERV